MPIHNKNLHYLKELKMKNVIDIVGGGCADYH